MALEDAVIIAFAVSERDINREPGFFVLEIPLKN